MKKHAKLPGTFICEANLKKFEFAKHTHEEYAIGIVESGIKKLNINNKSHTLLPGQIFTINPETFHDGGTIDQNNVKYSVIFIQPEVTEKIIKNEKFTSNTYFKTCINSNIKLWNQTRELIRLYASGQDDIMFETQLIETITDYFTLFGEKKIDTIKSVKAQRIEDVCDNIKENCLENINLDTLADIAGLSKYYFIKQFKEYKGTSPHRYILSERLKKSRQMLKDGHNIIETAYTCGFADQSHFTRCFKSAYAITPASFQAAHAL